MNKSILTFALLLLSLAVFGQESYYKMPNGKIIDLQTYEKVKKNLSNNGKLEEIIISRINRNDSIIITPKLNVLTQKDENGNFVDPYGEQKKLIGLHFPIELFKNEKGLQYPKDALKGKPTLINFWFTNCVPCVAEIPMLNSIKKDLQDKVNFFAITFENKGKVEKFLQKKQLDYHHVVNAKEQIDQLKVVAYPTNLILDKEGTIIDVYGEISHSEEQIVNILKELLL